VSDHRAELAEVVSGVLSTSTSPWDELATLGFTALTVPEHLGGSGGDLTDAAAAVAEAARHAIDMPLAEATFLAGPLLAAGGVQLPSGIITAGPGALTASSGGLITGIIPDVASLSPPPAASRLIALCLLEDQPAVAVVSSRTTGLTIEPAVNLAGEARGTAVLADVRPDQLEPLPPGDWAGTLELLGAAARAVQIGGAARAVLDLAVLHASQRVQFGRPLNRLQAVQQLLAQLAADTATATVAADAAVQALAAEPLIGGVSRGTELLVASAKAEASELATRIAATGHQVHGAIGYTAEHRLGSYTKRLWSWRQEYGNELHWHRRIASLIDGVEGEVWPLVTSTEGAPA
jgi:acyl-CoA dehydrogenase